MRRHALGLAVVALVVGCAGPVKEVYQSAPLARGSEVIFQVGVGVDADPFEAGRAAAEALRKHFLEPPHVVIVSECFEGKSRKQAALKGVCSVFPPEIVFGGATYGSIHPLGCADRDAIALLGIGGKGVSVAAALERELGTAKLSPEKDMEEINKRLRLAGASLAGKLFMRMEDRLAIVFADAHSPKNAPLVDGVRHVLGKEFPITGGSVNKNAGQTFVYFQGRPYEDSAVAVLVAGMFKVSMAGRQAKEGEQVLATAKAAVAEAAANLKGKPFAVLAFDCAGRKGKIANVQDEVRAMQEPIGKELPLFGCYCAGEIGPADQAEKLPGILSSGVAWHIMVTALGQ